MIDRIHRTLGEDAALLEYRARGIEREQLHLPGPDFIDRVMVDSDRPIAVLRNLSTMFRTGRLAGTGYLSILPVDQGIEHSGAASFAPNPIYFDPENIVRLAIEGGCNAVASTLGVLGSVARRYAHRIPFIVKLNHNELLTHPPRYDQTPYASVSQAFEMGAAGIGATIYFGSEESRRQLEEISSAFHEAHELGMFTVLWCYLRNPGFKKDGVDYHVASDLTAQANHLGVTIEADIIKEAPREQRRLRSARCGQDPSPRLPGAVPGSSHRMDPLAARQLLHGSAGLINSGGASSGAGDLQEAVKTAVIDKRAGGMGLISGRKAFQRPMKDGVELLNAIQDVYACSEVTIA
ncbi:MAG: class I fructose-bisphosphate aldolase [Candidatus Eisenbacteria bacterium]